METVFEFIPEGWKATSPDTIEINLDNGDYAYIHKYPYEHARVENRYNWQVKRSGMHISSLVYKLPEAIDNATAFLRGPIDDVRSRYLAEAQDKITNIHKELTDLHKRLARAGIANPDTIYEQAFKAGYVEGVRDEHAAIIEIMDKRVPA